MGSRSDRRCVDHSGTVGATLLLLLVLSAPVEAQDDSDLAKKT